MTLPAVLSRRLDDHERARLLAEQFIETRKTKNTRAAYRNDLAKADLAWLPWCRAHDINPLDNPRTAVVETWLRHLEDAGFANGTRARRLAAVSQFYRWLIREDVVETNPVAPLTSNERPKMRKAGTAGTALSMREVDALLAAADRHSPRAAALVAALFFSGLRVSEAIGSNVDDLSTSDGTPIITPFGKGEEHRIVVVPPSAWKRLQAYLADRADLAARRLPALAVGAAAPAPLFVTKSGGRLNRSYITRLLAMLAKKANVPEISPHDLRRTYATLSLANGASLDEVQEQMGHKQISTTQGYDRRKLHVSRAPGYRLDAAMSRLHA